MMLYYLLLALDDGNVSLLALLDLSAAFDKIDHSILLHRLHHNFSLWLTGLKAPTNSLTHNDFGIQGTALDWFSSYLTNYTQSVSIHCYTSEPAPISFGVPHGSIVGPVLLVLYTASLFTGIEKHSVLHHSYADDISTPKVCTPSSNP